MRYCSYEVYDGTKWDYTLDKDSTYNCQQLIVAYTNVSNVESADLFRSYQGAKGTNYESAIFECKDPELIDNFVKEIPTKGPFTCFYNPEIPQYAYINNGLDDFSIVCLALLILDILLLIIWPCRCCCTGTGIPKNNVICMFKTFTYSISRAVKHFYHAKKISLK